MATTPTAASVIDSPVAWWRLVATLTMSTLGGVGMWSVIVALPAVQAEFGVDRGTASLPYTLTMVGFGLGGIVMGKLTDRYGVSLPLAFATLALAQGLLIGFFGSSATFGPLLADISHWFERRRGLAVSIVACGNYLAGTVWPPIVQHLIETVGWRHTHLLIGVACLLTMLPLTACCVAMSMPQVHIVAYCGDLGYGPAAGAQMLSLMLGFGIVSRLLSGWIADHIGGLRTLLLGSALQGVALAMYLFFDGLTSLYIVSALFGLFQGGIVPSYAIVIREFFAPQQAGARVGLVLMATLFGMALGGWMSGAVFDLTGSYRAAFLNGTLWNLLNLMIVVWLIRRPGARFSAPRARAA